jgi:hypothetical protein
MVSRKQEVIFEAKVEYSENDRSIREGKENHRIEEVVVRTLTLHLPRDLDLLFGLKVDIYIKGTRYGSLSVFFGAVLAAYGILSGYKGFYESAKLIREQAEDILEAALSRLGEFRVDVSTRYPSMETLNSMWFKKFKKYTRDPFEAELLAATMPPYEMYQLRRDGFFYFLLALSIVELVVIGLLVYGAVIKTYF